VVTAIAGTYAAAIGSGTYAGGGNITIRGNARVYASAVVGAGIGGGSQGSGGNITIEGNAVVYAAAGSGAGIGGGMEGGAGNIIIKGNAVVYARSQASGIGPGWCSTAPAGGSVTINGGIVYAYSITAGLQNAIGGVDTVNITGGTVVGNAWVTSSFGTPNLNVVKDPSAATGPTLIVADTLGNAVTTSLTVNNAALLVNTLSAPSTPRTQTFTGGTVASVTDNTGAGTGGKLLSITEGGASGLETSNGTITLNGPLDLGGNTLSIPPGWELNRNGNTVTGSVVGLPGVTLPDGTHLEAGNTDYHP
jgi:hypothetical protein